MIITTGKQNNKSDIRKLWDDCFDEDSKEWRDWYFENIYNDQNIIAGKENGKLAAMLHMNPYELYMRGSKISAFAMAGVATAKEYRYKGFADKLIKYSLRKAYTLNYDFSFLYPFKYKFYEKYGYMLAYNKHEYHYKHFADSNVTEMIKTKTFSYAMFTKIYTRFASDKNGFVMRDAEYFKTHIKELLCDGNELLCFYIDSKAGYLSINKDENKVEELVYEGDISDAIKAAVRYYETNLTFDNLYDSENMINTKQKHCMARVVSVENIFKKIQIKDCDIKLRIKDNIIEENNAIWHIKSSGGKTEIMKTNDKEDFNIEIAMLAPIITGLEQDNEICKRIQDALFDKADPYIYEVC